MRNPFSRSDNDTCENIHVESEYLLKYENVKKLFLLYTNMSVNDCHLTLSCAIIRQF